MSFKERKERLKNKRITLSLFYIKPTPIGDNKQRQLNFLLYGQSR